MNQSKIEIMTGMNSLYPVEPTYSKTNVESLINHLLSRQKHFTGGSYISVNDIVEECKLFGLNINPEGKSIHG